jgi:hypothetical protein
MKQYRIEEKRELPNAPMMLAFFMFCLLLAGFLTSMVKTMDAQTALECERIRARTQLQMLAQEQPYNNAMAARLQKPGKGGRQ